MVKKAELHVHIEGTATPSLVQKIAKRNKIEAPVAIFGPHETYLWNDFLHFHSVYDLASSVIRTPQDFYDIVYDYLARCAKEEAIYVEFTSSPDHAFMSKLSYANLLEGITSAMKDAKRDFGIESRSLMVIVRHFSMDKIEKVIHEVIRTRDPLVTGINLAGAEKQFPPSLFTKVFQRAHHAGLRCTAHAGEAAGPESVWEALKLPISRIGHGVRSIEDKKLVEELVRRKITLEVCPNSNLAFGIYPDIKSHPFLQLRAAGIPLTLNSDDPPFFGTSIGKEYDDAKKHFGLNDVELLELTRNSIRAAFIDEETQKGLLSQL